jgi:hypothetical protein
MSKSISLTIETQTEESQVISLCHINEKMLALEGSLIANKMLKMNRSLFSRINNTTKIIGGSLYRQEVVKSKGNTNRTYVKVDNKYETREVEIGKLIFENNRLIPSQRAISKYGKKFDFNPNLVSDNNTGGTFNVKKLSPSDIEASELISTIEEVVLFQDKGVKSFMITDNLKSKKSLIETGYRIQIIVHTEFKQYVEYAIKQAESSIVFLNDYLNSLGHESNYDLVKMSFKEEYTSRIMSSIGLPTDISIANVNTPRIRNSNFGKTALSYYNIVNLLSPMDKKVYSKVLKTILPTNRTSPEVINDFLRNFNSVLESVRYEYLGNRKKDKKGLKYSKVDKKISTNVLEAISKEKLKIELETLGYTVFSNRIGQNMLSASDYKNRLVQEQAKHYPRIEMDDASSFMTKKERDRFARLDNAPAFLTPNALVMGDRKIRTNRGMSNLDINDIREFRLAKSKRFEQQRSERVQNTSRNNQSLDSLSSLNVVISSPKIGLLKRALDQNIDPLVDSKHYVGTGTDFATNNPLSLAKNFKRIRREEDRRVLSIASDIIPRRFLRNNRSIKSIKEIQFSNPKSIVRKLAIEGTLPIESIPPQVKFMMSKSFNANPNSDPMQNSESREIIEETQKNLFLIQGLAGFRKNRLGFWDVHSPIYKPLNNAALSSPRPIIAKAYDYEVPELGIVKDNFLATIYNNLIYIRG